MNGFVNPDVTSSTTITTTTTTTTTTRRLKVIDLNPHLMCVLCGGYYIDATTIIECLHSFCKTCIVKYLETSKFCPICDVQVHKTKPLLNIRSDQTLQDIVYKLVPGLFQREMKRRRDFYSKQPPDVLKNVRSNEERGEVDNDFPHNIFVPDEFISVALEYSETGGMSNSPEIIDKKNTFKRYLRCPVVLTVAHIKKLIRAKYGLSTEHRVDLMFSRDCLSDDFMIMDIAYTYSWKRKGPLKLFFRIYERPCKRLKTFHNASLVPLFGAEAGKKNPSEPNEPAGQSVKDGTVQKKELVKHFKSESVALNGVKQTKDEKCSNIGVNQDDNKKKKQKCSVNNNDDNVSNKKVQIETKTVVAKVSLDDKSAPTDLVDKTKVESGEKKVSDCLFAGSIDKSAKNAELISKCKKTEENNNNNSLQEKDFKLNGEITQEQERLLLHEKVNGVVTENAKDNIQMTKIETT